MNHVEEKWEDVVDFPRYAVSSYGTVINQETNRELRQRVDKAGFHSVTLYDGKGGRVSWYVHRLVAQAFFLNYRDGLEVNFKNNNFSDCSVLNLTLSDKGCRAREKKR